MARLGVASALVDGVRRLGDVEVDERTGTVAAVGLPGPGRGVAVAGLVDLQVNGFAGVELRSCDPEGYGIAAAALAAHGATAIQPTFFSQSIDGYERSLAVLAEVRRRAPAGCRLLPAHLEGPFLSVAWHGAHRTETFHAPDTDLADRLLAAGPVGFVTLAPELVGGLELVRHLVGRGVVVGIGHSDATAAQFRAAMDAGARHLTHCWNAHRRLASRDPGPAGAALAGGDVVVGLVGDLVHVEAEVVLLTLRAAAGRVAVTTDAIAHAGAAAGEPTEHGRRVRVEDGVARLGDGTIAGGVAAPDDCLRNLVGLGVDLADAVDACGGVQRRLLGLPDVRLRPGDVADLVVLDDALEPVRTLVGGREQWAR
ncbi:MAG: N-acetylglucosamine-6-phosphate deacetylase [Microthrixaceae bacterium]